MKKRTFRQAETAKLRAENFTRAVLEDDDRADEIAEESVSQYAERKGIVIENPERKEHKMSTTLKKQVRELEEENESLHARVEELEAAISQAADLLTTEDEDEETDDDEEEEDE
jgi:uncharacterized protein YlxW (UPF0749 family)